MTAKTPRQLRAIGYVRVSRVNGRTGESYVTKEVQRETSERLAAQTGAEIVEWIEEEDVSGKSDDRPGFQRALSLVEAREADAIIVSKLSRFARNVGDLTAAVKRLDQVGGKLIIGEMPDLHGPWGSLVRTILGAVAELEVELAKENWQEVRSRAVSRGVYARKPPVGYCRDEHRQLIPDPATAELVRGLFQRRAGGASFGELLTWWRASGGPALSLNGLRTALANRVYLGEYGENGSAITDHHEPLVTVQEWDAAQRTITTRGPRKGREPSLLAGLLICSSCGRPMTRGGNVYRCQRQSSQGKCSHPMTVLTKIADPYIEGLFLERAAQASGFTSAKESRLDKALAALEAAEGELATFLTVAQASSDPTAFAAATEQRIAARDAAQARVSELRRERATTLHADIVSEWPRMPVAAKRKVLAAAIEKVTVLPRNAASSKKGEADFSQRSEVSFRDGSF